MAKTIELNVNLLIDEQVESVSKDANDLKRMILNGTLKRSLERQKGILKATLTYKEYGKTN